MPMCGDGHLNKAAGEECGEPGGGCTGQLCNASTCKCG
jgi:hypothetical protein